MSSQPERGAADGDDDSRSPIIQKNGHPQDGIDYAEYSIQLNRWFLRPIAIWPLGPDAGIIVKIVSYIQIVLCYFLISFLLVPCALHTFLEEEDSYLRLKMMGPLSFCCTAIIKYCFLVLRRDEISECLKHVAKDWAFYKSHNDKEIMLTEAKFGRFIASLCATFMYSGAFLYHTVMPLSCGVIVTEQNISFRPLVYPVYEAYMHAMHSPTYEIVFITQFFCAYVMFTITIGACSMVAVFGMHACGQFKILMARLNKLVDGDDNFDTVDNRMANIVELHIRTLGFVARIETVLTGVCLAELIVCTLNICFAGYYLMTEWEQHETINTITYGFFFISFTFNILIYCYFGEKLTEESTRVGTVTYMIDWYRLGADKARGLILILVMAKEPASITAGKMAELSMSSFCGVLRTALGYLNMLRQFAD